MTTTPTFETTASGINHQQQQHSAVEFQPLSWSYARARFRHILQQYVHPDEEDEKNNNTNDAILDQNQTMEMNRPDDDDDPNQMALDSAVMTTEPSTTSQSAFSWILMTRMIDSSLDLYLGPLLAGVGLLILAILCLTTDTDEKNNNNLRAPEILAAAIWTLVGTLSSSLVTRRYQALTSLSSNKRRRRYHGARDAHEAKKRHIQEFLQRHRQLEQDIVLTMEEQPMDTEQNTEDSVQPPPPESTAASTTCDTYPVLRKTTHHANHHDPNPNNNAKWQRLPSLLLVEGDIIALQVGDVAPADCVRIENENHPYEEERNKNGNHHPATTVIHENTTATSATAPNDKTNTNNNNNPNLITLTAGQTVTLEALHLTEDQVTQQLPPGRSTLPHQSEHLLKLCHNMALYQVQRAPIEQVLQDQDRMIHKSTRPSRTLQNLKPLRTLLLMMVPMLFLTTAAIILVRPDATTDTETLLSLTLPLPFLAALGVSPVVAPLCLFWLEIIGTARILRVIHPVAAKNDGDNHKVTTETKRLGRRNVIYDYLWSTLVTRLSLWAVASTLEKCWALCSCAVWWICGFSNHHNNNNTKTLLSPLARVPPASFNLLETLGVCTCFALVDDELACELNAIPQQLLIPSGHGLKLFDICPVYENDDDDDDDGTGDNSTNNDENSLLQRKHHDSDSEEEPGQDDDDDNDGQPFYSTLRQKILKRRQLRRRRPRASRHHDNTNSSSLDDADMNGNGGNPLLAQGEDEDAADSTIEVQFEDPTWWQHLPALKCIGLSCLVLEDSKIDVLPQQERHHSTTTTLRPSPTDAMQSTKQSLIDLITLERKSHQYIALAECIGFNQDPNPNGDRGDLSPFIVQMRFKVIDQALLLERLRLDLHERSSEQSKWWGCLRPEATCVVIQDQRTKAYQLLTVGDPRVVSSLCNEAWQGEISTILPLGAMDRKTIIETSDNWKLADLDVAAFGYAPVPASLEQRLEEYKSQVFLLDSSLDKGPSVLKDKTASTEWNLIRNQVFLGVLGSLVIPRREITTMLGVLSDSGVRFVYFSPRNMRRQKELASQMGIDVAWNCAISLRPLDAGQEDPHRMVSTYADWDVNARLPHGLEEVRRHLEEVDNVPLLVSLFTDTTKTRTADMLEVFQDYQDTVFAIGISHLPSNSGIFSGADVSVGVDVLGGRRTQEPNGEVSPMSQMIDTELDFVSAVVSHSCSFRLEGVSAISSLSFFIEEARAALEACTSAALFFLYGSISFSFFVLFSVCSPSTTVPHVPEVGAVAFLFFLLPIACLSLAFTKYKDKLMKQVPPKKDANNLFGTEDRFFPYKVLLAKAIFLAFLPQLLHMIVFGELVIQFEPTLIETECSSANAWFQVIRCDALRLYSGSARTSSGILVFAIFVLCSTVSALSFVQRYEAISVGQLCQSSGTLIFAALLAIAAIVFATSWAVDDRTGAALPWYFYIIVMVLPVLSLLSNEMGKSLERKREVRAEKLRRLQFETRLGAWSPK